MKFTELGLIPPILQAVERKGYTDPTPIQQQSIPIILKEQDLLGIAQTGTGKTAAFAIPTLQILDKNRRESVNKKGIKALIVTPTRELAAQIDESFRAYGGRLNFHQTVIYGGVKPFHQIKKLKQGVDVLVATPGRLLDLMNQGFVDLKSIEIFILDEADRMLDMGFINDVKKIIAKLPKQKQSLFFSATMPPAVSELAHSLLKNPERVEVAPVSSSAETVDQYLFMVERENKKKLLVEVLADINIKMVLVFTRTKYGADKLVKFLQKSGHPAQAIHGNKTQGARLKALKDFKSGRCRVLVATDIAARGIDVKGITHVINYEISNEPETYVHRIGRTGRGTATGIAFSFCDKEERAYVMEIEKLINREITLVPGHPYAVEFPPDTPKRGNRPSGGGNRGSFRGRGRR